MSKQVGRVVQINRYPVKSMAGEQLDVAEVDWQGIEGDRQYAFYRLADRGRFPWFTGRDLPDMILFEARFRDPAHPKGSPVEVVTPDRIPYDLHDPELIDRMADAAGCDLGLMQLGRGLHDAMPVSIVSTVTQERLDAASGERLDHRRFRANIVIEADVPENAWAGELLRLGDAPDGAELIVADGIPRCAMITIDPSTGERSPALMRMVAQKFSNQVGVYASPAAQGYVRIGDPVYLKELERL